MHKTQHHSSSGKASGRYHGDKPVMTAGKKVMKGRKGMKKSSFKKA